VSAAGAKDDRSDPLSRALAETPRHAGGGGADGSAAKRWKHRVRDLITTGLWHTRRRAMLPPPGTLTVVTLHRFLPEPLRRLYPWPELAVTPAALRRMLRFFRSHFRVLPLSEALDQLDAGAGSHPLLALTIDDGQWDGFQYARPLFREAGVRATFYVPTDAIDQQRLLWPDRLGYGLAWAAHCGFDLDPLFDLAHTSDRSSDGAVQAVKRLGPAERSHAMGIVDGWLAGVDTPSWGRMMNWDEVRVLADEGHEIGGHSSTHPILPLLADDELAAELVGCKRRLDEAVGGRSRVRSFAYPNGDHDDRVCRAVRSAGFENAVTARPSRTRVDRDPFRIGRFDLQEERNQGLLGRVDAATLAFRLRDPHVPLATALWTGS
jgi:peptidoglycan/xylan/chitin deacetylase (PgdA/CDA1 family)